VIATGLGSAAIAGLYENKKAKKEEAEARKRSRSRSRSRGRSAYDVYDGPRSAAASDPGLIEYGTDPVYGNVPHADYYGRPAVQNNYYSNEMVPAGAAAGVYAAGRQDERSRDRRRSSSSSSSDRGNRRSRRHKKSRSRSGSRTRELATAGLAAGVGALAGHEISARKERKKADKARRRKFI